jgi:sporulation protein YlmC with PRC-barrel domain
VRLSELLSLTVTTESGRKLGRVHDVRALLRPRSVRVDGFVVGTFGLVERLGIGAPASGQRVRGREVVPWSAVVRCDRGGIVVRDGTDDG